MYRKWKVIVIFATFSSSFLHKIVSNILKVYICLSWIYLGYMPRGIYPEFFREQQLRLINSSLGKHIKL